MNSSAPSVLAIAAHPDDIEFVMSGTMLRLAAAGWNLHYFNLANGCCGSMTLDRQACAAIRLSEAQQAAELLSAKFYAPICNDLEIFYTRDLLAKVASVVRQARPRIVLTHALYDYMEDHQNAARLAQTAAFAKSMPNFITDPATQTCGIEVTLYHAQPHGNRTPLGEIVRPTHYVDVTDQLETKRQLLLAHASQAQWLDETQKLNSYIVALEELNSEVGKFSGRFQYAEGWRKHLHLGFCSAGADPLRDALGNSIHVELEQRE